MSEYEISEDQPQLASGTIKTDHEGFGVLIDEDFPQEAST